MEKEFNNKKFIIIASIIFIVGVSYFTLTMAAGSVLVEGGVKSPFDLFTAFSLAFNESPFYFIHFNNQSLFYFLIGLALCGVVIAWLIIEDEKNKHDKLGGVKWNSDIKGFNMKFNEDASRLFK